MAWAGGAIALVCVLGAGTALAQTLAGPSQEDYETRLGQKNEAGQRAEGAPGAPATSMPLPDDTSTPVTSLSAKAAESIDMLYDSRVVNASS